MGGRVRRRLGLEQAAARPGDPPPAACALCDRPLGTRIEWHHVIPRSRGGRDTVPLHPICHHAIHAGADNAALERLGDIAGVRALPEIARFLRWIAAKPPDFHAVTRLRR